MILRSSVSRHSRFPQCPEQCRRANRVWEIVRLHAKVLPRQFTDPLTHFKLARGHGRNPHGNSLREAMAEVIDRHRVVSPIGIGKRNQETGVEGNLNRGVSDGFPRNSSTHPAADATPFHASRPFRQSDAKACSSASVACGMN